MIEGLEERKEGICGGTYIERLIYHTGPRAKSEISI
jgi:hypothetical protein